MLNLHIFYSNTYGIQSSRDAFDPLISPEKLLEAQPEAVIADWPELAEISGASRNSDGAHSI